MASRQDIDALLIGALYGELTPAEEKVLAAHLESHPTDRTALEDLTRAREIVRESRILQVQHEPPQAVSALLIQEAARRAPKKVVVSDEEKESWFARFLRSFMAHPAMAAAAMLVVVVGVATMVTKRKGDHFAETSAPAARSELAPTAGDLPTGTTASGSAAATAAATGETEQYQVDLDDSFAEGKADRQGDALKNQPAPELAKEEAPAKGTSAGKLGKKDDGIELRRAEPMPKDFEAPRAKAKAPSRSLSTADEGAVDTRGGVAEGTFGGATTGYAAPPSPAPAQVQPTAPPAPPPKAAASRDDAPEKKTVARTAIAADKSESVDPLFAWAREQHAAVVAHVRAGNCTSAGKLANTIANRAPSYYEQNVATDRAVKECSAYIAAERQRDEQEKQRAQRSRASDSKRANEPAKRAADQPSKPTATESK